MPDNSQVNRNGVQDKCSSYPVRPGERDCIYYLRTGMCGYGINCRFNHSYVGQVGQDGGELPERIGQPDCVYFLKTGTCKYGSTCKYHHPRDRNGAGPVLLNILGLPMRQEEKSCPYYMQRGLCKFGIACKFDHPQPLSAETVLSVPGPPQYGFTGLSSVNSSGLPYAIGFPAWSLPKATYIYGPPSQGPQTYMPVVLSPSQGIVPAQGWNTYVGSLSPISSPSVYGESGFNGQVNSLSTAVSHLPDRPECWYFLNTGSCKYGSDCKYHHPREKIAQSAISSLGPLGLPLRPGKGVCSYYNTNGFCKYGPTCKYDHPLVEYPYNYQLNSSTVHLSEISPSKSSSTVPDGIHKHEVASEKNLKSNSTPEDSLERAVSPSQSLAASSKNLHGQSE